MIVSCSNCSTKYNLPDDKVPASGIKVKCSKCSHVFKVQPPAATPEEEVEVLLDDSADAQPQEDKSSDFDAAFEEAVAGGDGPDADEGGDDDFNGLDDMDFGDDAAADDGGDDGGLGDMDFGDDEAEEDAGDDDGDDLGDLEDDDDDFGIADDDDDDDNDDDLDDLGGDLDDDLDDDLDSGSGSDLNLGGEGGLFDSLDDDGQESKKGGGIGKLLKIVALLLLLGIIAAIGTFNVGLWSLSPSAPAIELPFDLPVKIPFLKGPGGAGMDASGTMEPEDMAGQDMDQPTDEAPSMSGGDPGENVKQIQPVEFSQYFISNEVEGRICVVEAKALNNSDSPKEQIQVEVSLFAEDGTVMASKEVLCGNTLSLFQLQVDDRATIDENLASSRGINLNNAYIKPGESTPFMVVFYDLEGPVEEYKITITGAQNAQR